MRLIATVTPTDALLQMFNEFSDLPGDWIHNVCGDEIKGVLRAEHDEINCEWKDCIFVPSVDYLKVGQRDYDSLFNQLRKDLGVGLPVNASVHILAHGGVLGICTL